MSYRVNYTEDKLVEIYIVDGDNEKLLVARPFAPDTVVEEGETKQWASEEEARAWAESVIARLQ